MNSNIYIIINKTYICNHLEHVQPCKVYIGVNKAQAVTSRVKS